MRVGASFCRVLAKVVPNNVDTFLRFLYFSARKDQSIRFWFRFNHLDHTLVFARVEKKDFSSGDETATHSDRSL